MIKVTNINPIDSKSKYTNILDLEDDFLGKFKKNLKPKTLIDAFIQNNQSRKFIITNQLQIDILNYLSDNFDDIIIANPRKIKSIINFFNHKNWDAVIYQNDKTTTFGKEILYVFGYSNRFRGNLDRGIWLAKQLNIKVCPYCNAQNTILTNKKFGNEILKFQFDHFFPKSEFPYLSISLYNLIPACANCNITKSSKSLNLNEHYHPYEMDLANLAKFKLSYNPDPMLLTVNNVKNQNLEIDFIPNFNDPLNIVGKHNELYHIKGIYNRYNDVAEELLITAIIYTSKLAKMHLKIKGLFNNEEDYFRYVLRNYPYQKDILKRPLAKFTQDISKQLKLYK